MGCDLARPASEIDESSERVAYISVLEGVSSLADLAEATERVADMNANS